MSLRALTWAFDLDIEELTSTLTLVLITLANYANEEDETYPRQSTIAKKTKLSRQTVNTSLARLEELGLITCTPRTHATGAFRSSIYKLLMPAADRVKSADMGDSETVSNKATRRVHQDDRPCQAERQGVSSRATEGVGDDDTFNRILEARARPGPRTVQHLGLGALGQQTGPRHRGPFRRRGQSKRASDHHSQGAPQAHRRKHWNSSALVQRDHRTVYQARFLTKRLHECKRHANANRRRRDHTWQVR
jgi:DNA-binding MarR family transcriptional regulator